VRLPGVERGYPDDEAEKTWSFDSLSAAIQRGRPPTGYRMCRREPLPDMSLEETDELVSAVGGWRVDERYVLPLSAFDEAGGRKPSRDDGTE
jgi:hypothetical protein